jgi:hypothetical protein
VRSLSGYRYPQTGAAVPSPLVIVNTELRAVTSEHPANHRFVTDKGPSMTSAERLSLVVSQPQVDVVPRSQSTGLQGARRTPTAGPVAGDNDGCGG